MTTHLEDPASETEAEGMTPVWLALVSRLMRGAEDWAIAFSQLPDGTFGGYRLPRPLSLPARNGWAGGTVPGCFRTYAARTGLDAWGSVIQNTAAHSFQIYAGFVHVDGAASTVRDSATGATAPVDDHGYFLLAEPNRPIAAPKHRPAWMPDKILCAACDVRDLQVLNAAGRVLKPDYAHGTAPPG